MSVRVSVYHIFYCSVYHIFRRPEPSKKVASKHPNSECLRQNVTGCSDSLTVFNTDSTYYLCICERITEPESATNAARSASSKHCYTQKLLATEAVTHTSFYTPTLLQTRLRANAFTHTFARKRFYTLTLLHTNTFTHGRFYK